MKLDIDLAREALAGIDPVKVEHLVIWAIIDSHMDEDTDWYAINRDDWKWFGINRLQAAKALNLLEENGVIRKAQQVRHQLGRKGILSLYSTKSVGLQFPDFTKHGLNIAVCPALPDVVPSSTDEVSVPAADEAEATSSTMPF